MKSRSSYLSKELLGNYWLPAAGGVFIAGILSLLLGLRLELQWKLAFIACLLTPFAAVIYGKLEEFCLILFLFFLPLNISTVIGGQIDLVPHPGGALNSFEFYLCDIPLLALYVFWFGKSAITTRKLEVRFSRIDLALLGYLAWACLSVVNSVDLRYSLFEIIRLFRVYLIYFYFANRLKTRRDLSLVVVILLAGLLLQSVITYFSYYFHLWFTAYGRPITLDEALSMFAGELHVEELSFEVFQLPAGFFRAGGTVGPFNVEAEYLGLLLPLPLVFAVLHPHKWIRVLCASIFLAGAAASVLTFSRGGWISIFLSSVVILGVCYRRELLPRRTQLAVVLVAFLGAISILVVPSFREKVLFRFFFKDPEVAVYPRVEMMEVALKMFTEHPILGFGVNTYVDNCPRYYPGEQPMEKFPVHNRYLIVAVETGLVGLVFFLLFYLGTFQTAFACLRRKDTFCFALGLAVCGGFVGLCFHMMVDICTNLVLLICQVILAASVRVAGRLPEEAQHTRLVT